MNGTRVRSPFEVLGLAPSADESQIQAMYRHLAKKYHPDAGGDAERFKEVQWAYEQLSDPVQRASWAQRSGSTASADSGGAFSAKEGPSAYCDDSRTAPDDGWAENGPEAWDQYMSGAGLPCPPTPPPFRKPARLDSQGCYKRAWPGLHYLALGTMAANWMFVWARLAVHYWGASPSATYSTYGPVAYWALLNLCMPLAVLAVAFCVRRLWVVATLVWLSPVLLTAPLSHQIAWLVHLALGGAAVCLVGAWRLRRNAPRAWGRPYLLYRTQVEPRLWAATASQEWISSLGA
jgi:hypothetical protein